MKRAIIGILLNAVSAFGFLFTLSGSDAIASEPNALICKIRSDMAMNLAEETRTNMLANIISQSYIGGFHIQLYWRDFEPSQGQFDYSIIDECIHWANLYGKSCSVALAACHYSPAWLTNSLPDSSKFTFRHPHPAVGWITSPIPWDATYQSCLNAAVDELANNYDGLLSYISVTGPSSLFGIEVNFPCAEIDEANSDKLGFTRQKYEDEWKDSIDYFYSAFTNSPLGLTLHSTVITNDLVTAPALRSYLLNKVGTNSVVFKLAGLSDETGLWPGPYEGIGEGSDYQELIVPVKDLENVHVALEAGSRMVANGFTAEKVNQILINGLSFDANSLEFSREDIWDVAVQQPTTNYAAQMAWCGNYGVNQVNLTHEQGGVLDNWDSVVRASGSDISIGDAGLAGTQKGLIVNSAASGSYVTKDLNLDIASRKELRFRFYIDPNSILMSTDEWIRVVRLKNSSGTDVCYIALWQKADGFHLSARVFDDTGSQTLNDTLISNDEHYVEMQITRSDSATASTGSSQIWIDDVSQGVVTGVDNYDRFDEADSIQVGNCYASAPSASRNFRIDEVRVQGHPEYIGPRYQ